MVHGREMEGGGRTGTLGVILYDSELRVRRYDWDVIFTGSVRSITTKESQRSLVITESLERTQTRCKNGVIF